MTVYIVLDTVCLFSCRFEAPPSCPGPASHLIASIYISSCACRISDPNSSAAASAVMQVDEEALTVTVQAGVPQRDLLDYLAKYQ